MPPHGRNRDHDVETMGQAPEVFIAEQHAAMARLRGEKELKVAATNIQNEYKRRLEETRGLALRLEKQLAGVRTELETARATRQQLMGVLAKVQCPLQLCIDWDSARKRGRPQTASGGSIKQALTQSVHDLKACIDSLTSELVDLDAAIIKLQHCEASFVAELRSKASTMVLDRACLDGETLSDPATIPKPPSRLSPAASPRGANNDSPSSQQSTGRSARALMQTHGLHTENEWRNQTFASLSHGVSAIEDSKRMRKRAQLAIRGIEDSGKTLRPACVVDALVSHIKYETQQLTGLKYNSRMVSGEMATLEKHMGTVQGTLDKVRQQLASAEHRLDLQVVRPASEVTRTGVEEVLEVEVVNMRRTEQTLLTQLKELNVKRQRLAALRAKIETEAGQRTDSLALDKACNDMSLPALPNIRRTVPQIPAMPTQMLASPRRRQQQVASPRSGRNAAQASPRR